MAMKPKVMDLFTLAQACIVDGDFILPNELESSRGHLWLFNCVAAIRISKIPLL